MSPPPKDKYRVLLVDDSKDDRLFMRWALRSHPKLEIVAELRDGEEAISYLSGLNEFGDREKHPFPDLMLLDLKMPRQTGLDVLKWLQTQIFNDLVVIVVSGSNLPQDVSQSLALGAAAFHKKTTLLEQKEAIFKQIDTLLQKS